MKRSRYTSLLGIALEGGHLRVALVRRNGGRRVHVRKTLSVPLSLDPLTNDPELVGLEIRNHLREAGIRERNCVVCLPQTWALSIPVDVPDIADSDLETYLEVQAEREFPFPLQDLSISASKFRTPSGGRGATLVAIPSNHLALMHKTLKAARLRVADVTLGVTSLADGSNQERDFHVNLLVGSKGIDLSVTGGGGVAILRRLEEPNGNPEDSMVGVDTEAIARQLRITLGQLPEEVRERVRVVQIFGAAERAEPLLRALKEKLQRIGIEARLGRPSAGVEIVHKESPSGIQAPEAPAMAAAACRLADREPCFSFSLAKKRTERVIFGKTFSRRALWAGASAILIAGLLSGAVIQQKIRLSRLETEWTQLEPRVVKIEALRDTIHELRPWFSDKPDTLQIALAVTKAFPNEGKVVADSLDVKNMSNVTVAGEADDLDDWQEVMTALLETDGVDDLQTRQTKTDPDGNDPFDFSFTFKWQQGGGK